MVLTSFINHRGRAITNPYISNNKGCTPTKAELVWQDAPSLITDIKYNGGKNGGNISFKVNQATIRQGNAVIAIKDGSNTNSMVLAYLDHGREPLQNYRCY